MTLSAPGGDTGTANGQCMVDLDSVGVSDRSAVPSSAVAAAPTIPICVTRPEPGENGKAVQIGGYVHYCHPLIDYVL